MPTTSSNHVHYVTSFNVASYVFPFQGHVVGGAITGGFQDNHESAPAGQQPANTMQGSNPCQFEFEQFVQCAQNQHDITFCKGFNEVLKQCKIEHGKTLVIPEKQNLNYR